VITKVEVYSEQPSAPELPLGGPLPNDDPVQIRDIQGLGPVKAEISMSETATSDGALYRTSSISKRNIVLTLGLNADWEDQTPGSLRQLLYAYLMPKSWCKLRFFSSELPTVDIEGYVESFEPNIFSQDPEVQVSVLCPKPDFVDVDVTLLEGAVDNGDLEHEFNYIGTVATGFELRIDATGLVTDYTGEFTIVNTGFEAQTFQIDPVTVDVVESFKLNTVRSSKRAENVVVLDGTTTNLLAYVTSDSVWPQLTPGANVLTVASEEDGEGLAWTMGYFNRFGGL
jgi:hypothetical protein